MSDQIIITDIVSPRKDNVFNGRNSDIENNNNGVTQGDIIDHE